MTVYVVTIDFDLNELEPEYGRPVFDSVHTTRETAEKRCSEIMQGVNLTGSIKSAFDTYQWKLEHTDRGPYNYIPYYFTTEIIPVEIEKN